MSETSKTSSEIPVEVVYRAEDLAEFDAATTVGEPGTYPYICSIHQYMTGNLVVS